MKRIPRNYNGTQRTGREIKELLPTFMAQISEKLKDDPRAILELWPKIVGPKISEMARAVSFESGVLKVRVENSTLYSLLNAYEKKRLLFEFRKHLPKVQFRDILFRIG